MKSLALDARLLGVTVLGVSVLGATIASQNSQTPVYPPTSAEQQEIAAKLSDLSGRLAALPPGKSDKSDKSDKPGRIDPALVADVEVYRKAADYITRFPEEFFGKNYAAETLRVLDTGLARVKELEAGAPSWPKRTGHVVRGYRSRVDGSVQPYGLTIPASYDGSKPMRLDVWLHGTQLQLNEVRFITQQEGAHETSQILMQDYIQLEPFGRMNLSYRYSGETDVFEAIASVQERYNIDSRRILIRGHSMGGQGAWRLGLQHPGFFAALEASAGYVDTREYAGSRPNFPKPLTPVQEAALHYYDAQDYALNAFNIPTVGYGGENDAQLRASKKILEALEKEGFHFTQQSPYRWTTVDLRALFLVGPNTGHAWHPEAKKESEAFIRKALETSGSEPDHVRCITYTTRFNECHWLAIDGLDAHYRRAEIDAVRSSDRRNYTLTTKNISRLKFTAAPASYTIDGQALSGAVNPIFEKVDGRWKAGASQSASHSSGLRKVHGLQGPIDDAFLDSFLVVRGDGSSWNRDAARYAQERLDTFRSDFAKWLRGDIRIKEAGAVTDADIAGANLVLFGDPGSNRVMARVLAKLPIRWTEHEIAVGSERFPAADHVVAMIYPNPLNPQRYVVLNSGLTFDPNRVRSGTESLFFPRLGDYAVLAADGSVKIAGFFDDRWQLK